MQAFRAAVRVNVSIGLVVVSLVAELLFVLLMAYGLYRAVQVLQ